MAYAQWYDSTQVQCQFIQILCFVDRASRYNRVKKKQFDVQGDHKDFARLQTFFFTIT